MSDSEENKIKNICPLDTVFKYTKRIENNKNFSLCSLLNDSSWNKVIETQIATIKAKINTV